MSHAETVGWNAAPNTNLLTGNDSRASTPVGVTVTTSGAVAGTVNQGGGNALAIESATTFNTHVGVIRMQMDVPNGSGANNQTVTFSFSEPVYNLSFTVTDIDGGPNCDSSCNWNDYVFFNSDAGVPTSATTGATVAWNATLGRASGNSNADSGSTASDVTVTFAGPVNTVTVRHASGPVASGNPGNQWVFIDDLTFTRSPRVTISKVSNGGIGTFSFTGTNGFTAHNITTVTAGTVVAGPQRTLASQGVATTLTEGAPPAGFALTDISCTGLGSGTATPNLASNSVTLSAAAIVPGAAIACTFTNTRAAVRVQKTSLGGTGTFSFTQTNLASAPANITTSTAGTPAPASPAAINVTTIGSPVTITETPAAGYALTAVSCTDANSSVTGNVGAIGTFSGNTLTIPAANVKAGSDFTCVFTNTRAAIKVQKITTGGFGGPFSFADSNISGSIANIATTAINTATPTAPTANNINNVGTAVTITETPATGYVLTAASCTDANSAVTGNTGSIGSLSGNVLTIPAANVKAGSDFTCVFSNALRPTVKVQKTTIGGTGTFSFSQANLASAPANITTSAAGTPTPASPTAINVTTIGTAVTLTETPAVGYALTSASCTDANSAVTGNTGAIGTLSGNTLTIPAANVKAGADFTCVFTNTRATVKVQKVTTGGFGGPFSFAQTNLASAPAAISTTVVGTPAPAGPAAINVTNIGTAVTLTETPAAGYVLASASCIDANGAVTGNTGAIGTLSGNMLTIPAANVKAGSDFTCTFTNARRPTVKVQKTTIGGSGGPFSFAQTNLASAPANITTSVAGTPTPTSPTAINVTTIGTAVTLTETLAAGYMLTSASCTDANSTVTGNTGSFGTLAGNVLTIPAANIVPGADLTCVFNNSRTPTVKVQKTTIGGSGGPFSFAQTNLASTPTSITTAAAGTPTPASPIAINVTTIGAAVTLTETPATGYALSSASCTDANSAATGNTGAIGTVSGNTLTIPAANINAGADYTCVFTNSKLPTITLTKISNGGVGAFNFSGTNGFGSDAITTTSSGVGMAGVTKTLTAASTATSITETSIASGFVLASISCGGLGSGGTATPNLATATVNLNAAATAPGANIACTFTNGMPGLSVTKTGTLNDGGDGVANAGDTISYSFAIANTGTVTLTNVSASDPGATISGGPIASLAPGASDSTTITAVHTLTQAEIDSGSYANTVTISGNPPTGPPVTAADIETVTLPSAPSFTVVKAQSAGPNPVTSLPSTLTYTITVVNIGNRTLTAPVITDSLVQGTNTLTLTSGPTLSSGDTDSDNALDTTETWLYTATYAVTQANLDHGGNIVNTATFDSAETAPVTSAPISTPITQTPGLTIVKTADTAGPVAVNDVIAYTYTITNTGNVTINGVTVNDVHNGYGTPPAPGSEAVLTDQAPMGDSTDAAVNSSWDVLAPGDSITFTATYTITQTDVDLLQ